MSSSAQSNLGRGGFYESGDQKNVPQSEAPTRDRYEEGQHASHMKVDAKDSRSIYNKADAETRYEESDLSKEANKRNPPETRAEAKFSQMDPTKPASLHGHQPSKGAKIDRELQEDDEQRLREKGLK
ncbi:hypothetical protein PHISP_06945 [Aspergillus sp. HF37]|nr:hypothetical protein PHISP_06945 [Aspergillus sp. HF37]